MGTFFTDIGRGAWISARAFTSPSKKKAVLVLPLMLLIFLAGALQRGIVLAPDRHGVVLIRRHRPWASFIIVLVLIAIALLTTIKALATAQPAALLGIAAVQLLIGIPTLIGVGVLLSSGGAQSTTLVGPHTPKGRRWSIGGLAQHPESSGMSALLAARERIRHLPPGSVLVTGAANEDLLTKYVRLGFTRESPESLRVYKVM